MRMVHVLVAVVFVVSLPAAHAVASAFPSDRMALVQEALRVRSTVGNDVWPGFADISTPIVLLDGERQWLIGHPPVDGFEFVETPDGSALTVQVGNRTIPGALLAAFPAHGVPAVVMATPEEVELSSTRWVLTAVHEMFHVFQMQRGESQKVAALKIAPDDPSGQWQLDFPFPYSDATARAMLHQQAWPCYIGAEALDEAEARYAAGVAVGASASLQAWLEVSGASPKSWEYAAFQQWKEGVASWVERETARRSVEFSLPESSAFDGAPTYEEIWTSRYVGQRFLAKHAGRASASRTIFYHLGMAKAMLLERLDPTWKHAYMNDGVWLDDLLGLVASGQQCAPPPE